MPAKKALRFMNTYHLTAPGTGPLFFFGFHEMSYAELLYMHEIVDHAHAILNSIALVKVFQPLAGKPVAAKAVPGFTVPQLLTGLDPAGDAGFRFAAVVAPATGAWVLLSRIRDTETAVHSAGREQRRSDGICLCRSYWRHVRIPLRSFPR
jgi:hypothetical protein